MGSKCLKIHSKDYKLHSLGLTNGYLNKHFYIERKESRQQINVFSEGWVFAAMHINEKQLSIRLPQGYKPLSEGLWGMFIPSFSILDWKFSAGELSLQTLTSRRFLPKELLKHKIPIVFPVLSKDFVFPSNLKEVSQQMSNLTSAHYVAKTYSPSTLAKLAKGFIDTHFLESFTISSMASQLGSCREVLTRQFKQAFDLSPVSYRNSLRSDEALRAIMLDNNNVTEAGLNSGFSDLSGFHRQFKSRYHLSPKEFIDKS